MTAANPVRTPLYWRLLRLHNLRPSGWQRALFADLPVAVAVILVLSDSASAWTVLVLPLAVTAVVKAHDLIAGVLRRTPPSAGE